MQQVRIPPSSTRKLSKPGGSFSGMSTAPETSLTRHVPHVPDVQFVGMSTLAISAMSMMFRSGSDLACPNSSVPLKKRIRCLLEDMWPPSVIGSGPSAGLLVESQACLLHPLVELCSPCSCGYDEILPVLLRLDVTLYGQSLVDPVIYVHQPS